MEGVSSAAVCLYRLREECVRLNTAQRQGCERGGGRELRFLFTINLVFVIMGFSLSSSLFYISIAHI